MRINRTAAIGLVLAVAGAAFALRDRLRSSPPGPPALRCPSRVEFGNRDVGSVSVGTVVVANAGGQNLVIDRIRTSCSCTGLERHTEDGYLRVESLTVPPGQSVELIVRLSVAGRIGDALQTAIYFRTNDPQTPVYAILAVVPTITGGVRTAPRTVNFGSIPVGETSEQVVDLSDYSTAPRAVKSVTVSPEDCLSVETLPPVPSAATEVWAGTPIARLRVRLHSDTPGPVAGKVLVTLAGPLREPDVIPITARVVGKVEVVPTTLLLPLLAGSGQPIYRGVGTCSAGGKPFTLTVEECPVGLTATILEEPEETGKRVAVELKPDAVPPGKSETRTIRLRAVVDGEKIPVAIPVLCRGVGP